MGTCAVRLFAPVSSPKMLPAPSDTSDLAFLPPETAHGEQRPLQALWSRREQASFLLALVLRDDFLLLPFNTQLERRHYYNTLTQR